MRPFFIEKHQLCDQCRKVRPVMNDGKLGFSVEEMLESKGYQGSGMGYLMINHMVLNWLENNGGCPKCINIFKRAVNSEQ